MCIAGFSVPSHDPNAVCSSQRTQSGRGRGFVLFFRMVGHFSVCKFVFGYDEVVVHDELSFLPTSLKSNRIQRTEKALRVVTSYWTHSPDCRAGVS